MVLGEILRHSLFDNRCKSIWRVYFIVHGNENIGAGHIMRSISLAREFQKKGYEVIFFSKYPQGIELIQEAKIKVFPMPHENNFQKNTFFYGNNSELKEDIRYIYENIQEEAEIIVVDSYNVSEKFFDSLRKLTKCLIYIDDLNAFSYPIDILINGTAAAFNMGYEKKQTAALLLGLKYNLLRSEFSGIGMRKIKNCVQDILITTGNSDPFHMTQKLLKDIVYDTKYKEITCHVIVGSGFDKDIMFNPQFTDNTSIKLYDKPNRISEIMLQCDLAVAAGGTTLYELAVCGVPTIVFAYADNQIPHISALEGKRMIKYIGKYDEWNEKQLKRELDFWITHFEERIELIEKLQTLIDGNGCKRVVLGIEQWIKSNVG